MKRFFFLMILLAVAGGCSSNSKENFTKREPSSKTTYAEQFRTAEFGHWMTNVDIEDMVKLKNEAQVIIAELEPIHKACENLDFMIAVSYPDFLDMLFWKKKQARILKNGEKDALELAGKIQTELPKVFDISPDSLKNLSSDLMSLYQKAVRHPCENALNANGFPLSSYYQLDQFYMKNFSINKGEDLGRHFFNLLQTEEELVTNQEKDLRPTLRAHIRTRQNNFLKKSRVLIERVCSEAHQPCGSPSH